MAKSRKGGATPAKKTPRNWKAYYARFPAHPAKGVECCVHSWTFGAARAVHVGTAFAMIGKPVLTTSEVNVRDLSPDSLPFASFRFLELLARPSIFDLFTGIGKPEPLRYGLSGYWSRGHHWRASPDLPRRGQACRADDCRAATTPEGNDD